MHSIKLIRGGLALIVLLALIAGHAAPALAYAPDDVLIQMDGDDLLAAVDGAEHVEDGGVWVEEGATNLIDDPSYEVGGDWSSVDATLSQNTTDALFGDNSLDITISSVNLSARGSVPYALAGSTSGLKFTASAFLRAKTDDDIGTRARIALYATGGSESNSVLGFSEIYLSNSWQRIDVSEHIITDDRTNINVLIYPDRDNGAIGSGVTVDAVQLEKALLTTYIDGSLGTGYSWSGTAHASTSTRQTTTLSLDASAFDANGDWAARMAWEPQYASGATWPDDATLIDARGATDADRIRLMYDHGADSYVLALNGSPVLTAPVTFAARDSLTTWLDIDYSGNARILHNGSALGSVDISALSAPSIISATLGHAVTGDAHANALWHSLDVYDGALSDDDGAPALAAWYPLDEPYGVRYDAHGAYHLTDNNTVLSGSGIQNGAALFQAANSESLSYLGDVIDAGAFTAVGWINRQSAADDCQIVANDWWSLRDRGGRLEFWGGAAAITHSLPLPYYSWTFVAIRHEGNESTLTLNSSHQSQEITIPASAADGNLVIGAGCNAYLDEIALYDYALSDAALATLYNGGAGTTYDDGAVAPDTDTHTAFLPLIANGYDPSAVDPWPGWGDDDDDGDGPIVINWEDDTSWWEWANVIGDGATPLFGWLGEVKVEIEALSGDTAARQFDPTQVDRYHMDTLAGLAGEDALDTSPPSLAEQAATMGHAMGRPFGWIRASNRYLQDLDAWWAIALTTWMIGAIGWIAFCFTFSISLKLILWFVDLVIAVYHLIPVIG
jgi:hypothetical protein